MSTAFKIERFLNPAAAGQPVTADEQQRHTELMAAIEGLNQKLDQRFIHDEPDAGGAGQNLSRMHEQLALEVEQKREDLARMKDEMRAIYLAIDDTKKQILTIKETSAEGQDIARVAEELSSIVKGTEDATETILQSAETIETQASNLVAGLHDESQQAMACEIQEGVVNIFEACNFQDLTGQRITKVVKTFCFIEARITRMMDIWGGAEAFLNVEVEAHESRLGDKALLNGPALEGDESIASQDDIDALFD